MSQRIRYRPDKDCLWDIIAGRPANDSTIIKEIAQEGFKISLDEYKQMIRDNKDLHFNRAKKKKPVHVLIREIYGANKDSFGLRFYLGASHKKFYAVDKQNQVTPIPTIDPTNMLLSAMHYQRALNDFINDLYFFNEDEPLLPSLMPFNRFVELLNGELEMDMDLRLKDEPQLLSWDSKVPAIRQLDPATILEGPTPNWDSFCERLDYSELFKAFIWSIFEPTNMGRQALWLRGDGNDGKSSAINAVVQFLGTQYTLSIGAGDYERDFFWGNAFGKRLAVYMDCKNYKILRTEKIKSLTGSDTVNINQKYERNFSAKVHSRLIVISNNFPTINFFDESEVSRLLLVQIKPYKDRNLGDPSFYPSLLKEMPYFLFKCKELYAKYFSTGMDIEKPSEMLKEIATKCHSLEAQVTRNFIEERLEWDPATFFVPSVELYNEFKNYFASNWTGNKSDFAFEDLKYYLNKKGIRGGSIIDKNGKNYKNCYIGVKIKGSDKEIKEIV